MRSVCSCHAHSRFCLCGCCCRSCSFFGFFSLFLFFTSIMNDFGLTEPFSRCTIPKILRLIGRSMKNLKSEISWILFDGTENLDEFELWTSHEKIPSNFLQKFLQKFLQEHRCKFWFFLIHLRNFWWNRCQKVLKDSRKVIFSKCWSCRGYRIGTSYPKIMMHRLRSIASCLCLTVKNFVFVAGRKLILANMSVIRMLLGVSVRLMVSVGTSREIATSMASEAAAAAKMRHVK